MLEMTKPMRMAQRTYSMLGNDEVVGLGVSVDVFFQEFACEADYGEKGEAGEKTQEFGAERERGSLRECDCVGHETCCFPFVFGKVLNQFFGG